MKKIYRKLAVLLLIPFIVLESCGRSDKTEIIIFHAGSLSVPLKEAAGEYMKMNPGIDIKLEGAGSVACARKITELNKPCDIMASADHKVIEKFLMPDYSDWNIWFASNELVIAQHDKSKYTGQINQDNWYDILSRNDVVYGRSDPNADPCGYRSVMMFKLAEDYYEQEGLTETLMAKDLNMVRPKEVDLVALMETSALDYIVQYKSVCEQHGLDYISLPPEINLSDPSFEDLYNTVSVDITGDRPGETIEIKGSSMIYGITLLNDAPNREAAIDFLHYFLGEEGRSIIRENGQTPLDLHLEGPATNIPDRLMQFFNM
ncbi:MAG: tungstate ABC transporter substrate-binding protein WtpA [Bacteroidales bacterium]|jgi:molybdate/tungstate transport system substrate-binding protein|nr:tungstate ABC transporter substrate-binding protein WtpA [Bacteroidales bacterium]